MTAASVTFLHYVWHPLVPGRGYNLWSGIASCFVGVSIFTGVAAIVKHHMCSMHRCIRPGHAHPDHGQPICSKHYRCTPSGLVKHHGLPELWHPSHLNLLHRSLSPS